ncbi:MAG TPA: T9SS type A sorting domain-containing protein [Ferruginibacter sp.]|nr:T9SS type A sorting domain-containing protein [Ferruginibacter sp.]HRO05885.1 T9SS type A sorting domain-containing protein [Ferruginibacter sp.]HRO96605.1 T9SS type A sorting domain-containing protein [Ferruginibacter sp.]HRP48815.1 T9SS type A sorting domain-containing protein [Ferruginibacter sp.]
MSRMLPKCCVLLTLTALLSATAGLAQTNRVDAAKSVVNVSKKNGGGTFEAGDTLEIRVTVAVLTVSGTRTIIDQARIFDQVPANTTYLNGSLRVTTNEGILYKGPFTEAIDADQGSHVAGNININIGRYATGTVGGRLRSDSSRPSFFGNAVIMMASYRVRINPALPLGTIITTSTGSFTYRMRTPTPVVTRTVNFPAYKIILNEENNACSNGMSVSAASDFQGTFGRGNNQNRAAALAFTTTYTKMNIAANAPNDYYYAIVNNSSPTASTNVSLGIPNANRVFQLWDIAGDHTGAADPVMGNPPAAAGTEGGYMVLVNASYKTDTAYRETLTGLCPNTYYNFSAWIRNVCARCSSDSTGRGSGTSGFIPAPGNDSSGVRPNISFEIDGNIYYTSGDVPYSRSTPWRQFGFTFRTGPTQTTADFLIRNNSPGGGGNDWALDDITIAHCGPQLNMNYAPIALGCSANPFYVTLSDTVRYVFADSYVHFKWQKSNVGGTVWTDMTGPGTSGVGTPSFVNGAYQYVTNLPPFLATPADSGVYFRVIVATTADNLHNECSYTDGSVRMVSVINCGVVLSARFNRFHGELVNRRSHLKWQVSDEAQISGYEIEKSYDGVQFNRIGNVAALHRQPALYTYVDDEAVQGDVFYRIKMYNEEQLYSYSNIITLGDTRTFQLLYIENPISNQLKGELIVPEDAPVTISLFNTKGNRVMLKKMEFQTGLNNFSIDAGVYLPAGIYIIHMQMGNQQIRKKLIKF